MLKICLKALDAIGSGKIIYLIIAVICALHLFKIIIFSLPNLILLALILLLSLYIVSIKDYDRLREIGNMRINDRISIVETAIKAIEDAKKEIAESVEPLKLKE